MKVYFDPRGFFGKNIWLNLYIKPKKDGSGIQYDALGKEYSFYWANPEKAVITADHTDLPEDMWYSFCHGVNSFEVPKEKLDDSNWKNLNDLIYTKVSKKQVEALEKVNNTIDNITTIEEFKELYPIIKDSGFFINKVMDKLFNLCNLSKWDVSKAENGEIGISFLYKTDVYKELLKKLGIDTKII